MHAPTSGAAYVYYDPDVLPEGVKRYLPIQEPQGHGMSLEEYEQWRAKQAGYTPSSLEKKVAGVSAEEIAAKVQEAAQKSEGAKWTTCVMMMAHSRTSLPAACVDVSCRAGAVTLFVICRGVPR